MSYCRCIRLLVNFISISLIIILNIVSSNIFAEIIHPDTKPFPPPIPKPKPVPEPTPIPSNGYLDLTNYKLLGNQATSLSTEPNESINLYTGLMGLSYKEVSVPIADNLNLEFIRSYSSHPYLNKEFSYGSEQHHNWYNLIHHSWRFDGGYIVYSPCQDKQYDTCNPVYMAADGKSQKLIPDDKNPGSFITNLNWRGKDLNQYTFVMTDTMGNKYHFNYPIVVRRTSSGPSSRLYLTSIQTPDGQWVQYNYDRIYLKSITSSDPNKRIDIEYTHEMSRHSGEKYYAHFPKAIKYNNKKIVTYNYNAFRPAKHDRDIITLVSAEYPDKKKYTYNYNWHYSPFAPKDPFYLLTSINHSNGDLSKYSYQFEQGPYLGKIRLKSKTLFFASSVKGASWDFVYQNSEFIDSFKTSKTIVKGPYNKSITWFSDYQDNFAWQVGLPLKHIEFRDNNSKDIIKEEIYTWDKKHLAKQARFSGYLYGNERKGRDDATYMAVPKSKVTIVDGIKLEAQYSDYDAFYRPQIIQETGYNNFNNKTRTTGTRYYIDYQKNIIDNIASKEVAGKTILERSYDSNGRLIKEVNHGVPTKFSYDYAGRLSTVKDAMHNITYYSNYNGMVSGLIRYPDDTEVRREVTNDGYIIAETDAKGYTTRFDYDYSGRKISEQKPIGAETKISYSNYAKHEARGDLEVATNYNLFGQPTKVITYDKKQNQTRTQEYRYDALGRKIYESYPYDTNTGNQFNLGHYYTYDILGRVLYDCINNNGNNCVKYDYNQLSSSNVKITIPNGEYKTYYYDLFNINDKPLLVKVSEPYRDTLIEYDELSNIKNIKQGKLLRKYHYDSYNRLVETDFPESGVTKYEYDKVGNLLKKTFSHNQFVKYLYDNKNYNLLEKSYSNTRDIVLFNYDLNSNLTGTISNNVETEYEYNANNQLISESILIEEQGSGGKDYQYDIKYHYNENSHLAKIIFPDGYELNYNPNGFGEAKQLNDLVNNINYHPTGQWESLNWLNGLGLYNQFDNAMRPISNRVGSIAYQYSYDNSNNLKNISLSDNYHSPVSFDYDTQGRLVYSQGPWGKSKYSYDVNDNLININYIYENPKKSGMKRKDLDMMYNSLGQLSNVFEKHDGKQIKRKKHGNSWQYDRVGNVISDTETNYDFDINGNLVGLTGKSKESYQYDVFNHRLVKRTKDSVIHTIYNKNGQELYEVDLKTKQSKKYLYLAGKKMVQLNSSPTKQNEPNYFFHDSTGSPIMMFDSKGKVVWRDLYLPYGERYYYKSATKNDKINKHWYAGKEQDANGLSYFGARYYNYKIGRFISPDPADIVPEKPETFNRYSYANNNPYKYVDPDGKFAVHILAAAFLGAASSAIVAAYNGESYNNVIKAATLGGVVGAIASFGGSTLLATVVESGFINAGQSYIYRNWTGNQEGNTVNNMTKDFLLGATLGGTGFKFSHNVVPSLNLPGCHGTFTNSINQTIRQLPRYASEITDRPKRALVSMGYGFLTGTATGLSDSYLSKGSLNDMLERVPGFGYRNDFDNEANYKTA